MDAAIRGLVLDANILIDTVLGTRVRLLLAAFANKTSFQTPDVCLADAHRNVSQICRKRGLNEATALGFLEWIEKIVDPVPLSAYAIWEQQARERIPRDPDDWPVVATALALDRPIWTEDRDFFGCRVATWITNTVEIYLRL
jgi:predicted nucleic acid-binding protein